MVVFLKQNDRHMKCYYKILGVTHRASVEEIKKAFRMLAMRWHPDRNPQESQAAQNFRRVVEAYETLMNPSLRHKYDKSHGYGRSGKSARRTPMERGNGGSDSLGEVFQSAFGIDFGGANTRSEKDLRFDLQVTCGAAMEGTFEEISYHRMVFCDSCQGSGRRSVLQFCEKCEGTGEREELCTLQLRVPPGSRDGARLRVPGGGDRLNPGIRPGDLVVVLYVV